MKEIDVTKMIAFRFWWSWFWRSNLFGILLGFLMGLVFVFLAPMLGITKETQSYAQALLSIIFGLIINILVIKCLLRQKYNKFRISVIDKMSNQEVKEVSYGMSIHFNWSYFWKVLLSMLALTIPASIIIGIIVGALSAGTSMSLNNPSIIIFFIACYLLFLVAAIFIQIFILKGLLKADYSDYRITVLELENEQIAY